MFALFRFPFRFGSFVSHQTLIRYSTILLVSGSYCHHHLPRTPPHHPGPISNAHRAMRCVLPSSLYTRTSLSPSRAATDIRPPLYPPTDAVTPPALRPQQPPDYFYANDRCTGTLKWP